MATKRTENRNVQILFIEDNPDEVVHIRHVLSEKNGDATHFRLFHAPRLEDGLYFLGEESIDVVLIDQHEHETDALTQLRSKNHEVPIVVLTALKDRENGSQLVSLGAQDYIVKDQVTHSLLCRTLLHAIERHKIHREHLSLANELRRANVRLEKLVYSDYLTGLMKIGRAHV